MTGGHAGLSVSQRESVRKGKLDAMAQQNKQSQFQQPSPRTTIISVVLFMLVAFFVGQQFLNMSSAGAKPTDRLITSEFVQAVEQDRATKVVYNAGDYTVSGSYYPAITAGSTGADAFNEAFQALNARMATLKNPETGKALGGVGTTDINGATLGVERNFTSGRSSMDFFVLALPKLICELFAFCIWLKKKNRIRPMMMKGSSVPSSSTNGLGSATSYGTLGCAAMR